MQEKHKFINHQFNFRRKLATIYRIVKKINNGMETGKYCMAVFRCFTVKYGEALTPLKEINSGIPQDNVLELRWLKKWRIKTNRTKSVHVMFITCKEICPLVILNGLRIRQAEDAKYLELHLDRRLNWKKHMLTKQKQFGFQLGKMYWLLSSKLQFSRK
ncbi:hypothetical protein HN011_003591 [Eciton burchellii]|nr:hypothetical protein HN011_003591 [Eciton burchellii]